MKRGKEWCDEKKTWEIWRVPLQSIVIRQDRPILFCHFGWDLVSCRRRGRGASDGLDLYSPCVVMNVLQYRNCVIMYAISVLSGRATSDDLFSGTISAWLCNPNL